MKLCEVVCEIEVTLDMISRKWKPLIMYHLGHEGTKRFGEINSYIKQIFHKSLTSQLKELEKDGLIVRVMYPEVPPKVEYSLSIKGQTLLPILEAMCEWGEKNMDDRYQCH